MPSRLPEIYWGYTHDDLVFAVRMKVGYEQVKTIQAFETLAIIASKAFGGGKSDKEPTKVHPNAVRPQNTEEMLTAFNAVFKPPQGIER